MPNVDGCVPKKNEWNQIEWMDAFDSIVVMMVIMMVRQESDKIYKICIYICTSIYVDTYNTEYTDSWSTKVALRALN